MLREGKIKILCARPDDEICPMVEGDIWCVNGFNGFICSHVQIGFQSQKHEGIVPSGR